MIITEALLERYLCEARKIYFYIFYDWIYCTKEGECAREISYSAIDSSSIINIDLTSNADLALLMKFQTFYRFFCCSSDYVSGKAICEIAATGNGNNLLRMAGQINNFFSCAICARLSFMLPVWRFLFFFRLIWQTSRSDLRFVLTSTSFFLFLFAWLSDVKK